MLVEVRSYKDSDYKKLLKLFNDVDKDFIPNISQRQGIKHYIKRALSKNRYTLVVFVKKELIGMINVEKYFPKKEECYIHWLAVLQCYRYHHIGTILINEALDIAKSHSFKVVKIRSWSTNTEALSLYKKIGFRKYCIVKNDRGYGIDSIYLKINV